MPDDYFWLNTPKEVAEQLLVDVAASIQLTPTQYKQAVQNYNALSQLVNEGDHYLAGHVTDIYPTGSFAIWAAILGLVRADQHDVDAVIELDLPLDTDPKIVLSALFNAIRGKPGSRYYDKTTLQSRCVTVTYEDGRTIDLMPAVRIWRHPHRVLQIFHWNAERGESYHKEVNPKGFADLFNTQIGTSRAFEKRFVQRMLLLEKAATEPLPDYQPLTVKAPRLVALQLIKRNRNIRWRQRDRKDLRQPPSVGLAALSLQQAAGSDYLIDETIDLANTIYNAIVAADRSGHTLEIQNPAWLPDLFTDRWPESREAQRIFAADMRELSGDLVKLRDQQLSAADRQNILKRHFGEIPTKFAFDEYGRFQENARAAGRTSVSQAGRVSILPATAVSLPKRTNFGGNPE